MRRVGIALSTAILLLIGSIGWAAPAQASDYLGLTIYPYSTTYGPGDTARFRVQSAGGALMSEPTALQVDFTSLAGYGYPVFYGTPAGFDSCYSTVTKIICTAGAFTVTDFAFDVYFDFSDNVPSTSSISGPGTAFPVTLSVDLPDSSIYETANTTVAIDAPEISLTPHLTADQTTYVKPGDEVDFEATFTASSLGTGDYYVMADGASITAFDAGSTNWTECASIGSPVVEVDCQRSGLTSPTVTTLTGTAKVPLSATLGSTVDLFACGTVYCDSISLLVTDDPTINSFTITPGTQQIGMDAEVAATFTAKAAGTHTIRITPPTPLTAPSPTATVTGAGAINCGPDADDLLCSWTGAAAGNTATVSFTAPVSLDAVSGHYQGQATITPPADTGVAVSDTAGLDVAELAIYSYEVGIGAAGQHSQVLPGGTAVSYVEFIADNAANGTIEFTIPAATGRATITAISGDTNTTCQLNAGGTSASCDWSRAEHFQVQRIAFTLTAAADAEPGLTTVDACAGGGCITGQLTITGDPLVTTTLSPTTQVVGGTFTATSVITAKALGNNHIVVDLPADSALYWSSASLSGAGTGSCSLTSASRIECDWYASYDFQATVTGTALVSTESFGDTYPVTTTVNPPTGTGQPNADSADLNVPEPVVNDSSLTMTPTAITPGETSAGLATFTASSAGNIKLHLALDPATAAGRARITQVTGLLGMVANCSIAVDGFSASCDWVHVGSGDQAQLGFEVSTENGADLASIRVEAMPGTQDAGAKITYLDLTGPPVIRDFTADTNLAPGQAVPVAATFVAGMVGTHTAEILAPTGLVWSSCSTSGAGSPSCAIVDQRISVSWDAQIGDEVTISATGYVAADTRSGDYPLTATFTPPAGGGTAASDSVTVTVPVVEATSTISASPGNVAAGGTTSVTVDYTAAATGNPTVQFYLDPSRDLAITGVTLPPIKKLGVSGGLTNCVVASNARSVSCDWRYATAGQVRQLVVGVVASSDATPGPVAVNSCANVDGNCTTASIGILGSPTISPVSVKGAAAPGAQLGLGATIQANAPGAHTAVFVAPAAASWLSGTLSPGGSCSVSGQLLTCTWTAAAVGDQVILNAITSFATDLPFGGHDFALAVTPPSGTGDPVSQTATVTTSAVRASATISLAKPKVVVGSTTEVTAAFTASSGGSTRVQLTLLDAAGFAHFAELNPAQAFTSTNFLAASAGGLANCEISGDGLTASCDWYGAAAGQVQTLTAAVHALAAGEVRISACAEGSTCRVTTLQIAAAGTDDDDLADTGFAGLPLLGIGLGLAAAGALLRRRRD